MASNTKTVLIFGGLFCLLLTVLTYVNFATVMQNFMKFALQRERRTGSKICLGFLIVLFLAITALIVYGFFIIFFNLIGLIFAGQKVQSEGATEEYIITTEEDELELSK